MRLKEYKTKRKFEKTPEPGPGSRHKGKQLIFVVHKHAARAIHYDLRLELNGVLKSWAVPKGPSLDPQDKKLAMMVEDHPIDYQTFEGVIPEGNYGAGTVMIWDEGTYHAARASGRGASEEALKAGLSKGHISFVLEGERLKGEFALARMKKGKENSWLLLKKKDPFADARDITGLDTSVATGRTMEEIEGTRGGHSPSSGGSQPDLSRIDLAGASIAPLPAHVKPMLATLAESPFDRQGWLFEIKWDGYRALAEVRDKTVLL